MNWYFVCDIMMNNGEKWWPIFLLENNSSCKTEESTHTDEYMAELEG